MFSERKDYMHYIRSFLQKTTMWQYWSQYWNTMLKPCFQLKKQGFMPSPISTVRADKSYGCCKCSKSRTSDIPHNPKFSARSFSLELNEALSSLTWGHSEDTMQRMCTTVMRIRISDNPWQCQLKIKPQTKKPSKQNTTTPHTNNNFQS